jgi:DNA-binding NarL/FixJ family response regulator
VLNVHVVYERVIVPQRRPVERSVWCVTLMSIAQTIGVFETWNLLDEVDHAVLQLLKEGCTLKEIATEVERSHRTVEHRVDALKTRMGARNLHRLIAISMVLLLYLQSLNVTLPAFRMRYISKMVASAASS